MNVPSAKIVVQSYFSSWRARDFERLRALLADDVTFRGPLGTVSGADQYVAGLRRLSESVTDIIVQKMFVDGSDVVTWRPLLKE